MSKQQVIILGSTGSIGESALSVLSELSDSFEVVGLSAGKQWKKLAQQARYWNPKFVALADSAHQGSLKAELPDGCQLIDGDESLTRLVEAVDADCVISAVVGAAGLPATLRAVQLGRKVALANKEPLVIAGELLMSTAEQTGATILPIDSEHSAVFQALQAGQHDDVERIVLTASGGPFRDATEPELEQATVKDALNHPTWSMGPKITIDSATMMNKALEIIEARWLFDFESDQIEVMIHPESILHSMVEFCDGSVIAQMGTPDMRTPIQYALTYPRRFPCPASRLSLTKLGQLTFHEPDPQRFPSLRLGHQVAAEGGSSGAVFNAANEVCNELFRQGKIGFCDIVRLTEEVLNLHDRIDHPSLDELINADNWARREVETVLAASPIRKEN
ncbi:MAG: 1-deoxy-D-xylulose 5-phosphate reductoisomerase [Phycisphaerae bacterium]|nr:MAG: 1-deoxy-D-xylulose 5-phosphate reductoisomerase [Phycisphaerae bacterium]